MKKAGCNGSVIQRRTPLVVRLQRAKVFAACRVKKYLTRKAIFSKKNEVNFLKMLSVRAGYGGQRYFIPGLCQGTKSA